MTSLETPQAATEGFENRKIGLVVFGIILIGLGAILGLAGLFEAVIATAAFPEVQEAGGEIPKGFGFFMAALTVLPAIAFIWLGVGSVLARRWARALALVLGWSWLILGVLGLVGVVAFMPGFSEAAREASAGQALSDQDLAMIGQVVKVFTVGFSLVFMVLLPLALVLFYRSPNVKATCEALDPKERWTDRVPLPVLGLVLLLAFGAVQCGIGALGPFRAVPIFGTMVHGIPAVILFVAVGLVLALLARGAFRLDARAWAAALALSLLGLASSLITSARMVPEELAEAMRIQGAYADAVPEGFLRGSTTLLLTAVGGLVWVGFLIYLKRYFPRREVGGPGGRPLTDALRSQSVPSLRSHPQEKGEENSWTSG